MEPFLNIQHVQKTFSLSGSNLEVLRDIDLDIPEGSFYSIVGASGCGKSTLLRIMAGLESATEGSVRLRGREVKEPTLEIGMIFQESRLFPWLSVRENIRFGIFKTSPEDRQQIDEHIKLVGLTGFETALPGQLSGGMQQRVSIARALVNRPDVLLLDEPFGSLDAFTRINMQQEILKIWEQEKTTIVLVTHDIDEAVFLADHIVLMSRRPGTIKKIVNSDMAHPRKRSSYEYTRLRNEIYQEFFAEFKTDIEYSI